MTAATIKAKLAAARKAADELCRSLKSDDDECLNGAIAFTVVSEESNPHSVHALEVTIDERGIRIETMEDDRSRRERHSFTWDELVSISEKRRLIDELDEELEDRRESLRDFGAPVPLKFVQSAV